MAGYLLLEGGAEFGGQMADPDRRAIELIGGVDAPISIIPTAAAADNNSARAGSNGAKWFKSLGATKVEALPIVDVASANDTTIASRIVESRLIYMLGGFPAYLGETLKGSASWQAMQVAYEQGAVIAGSSAGAMVLCQYYYDPHESRVMEGLGLLPNTLILPHHNSFGAGWAKLMATKLPDVVLIGIDERTGMLDDGEAGRKKGWSVYGQGVVTIYRRGEPTAHMAGEHFEEDFTQ